MRFDGEDGLAPPDEEITEAPDALGPVRVDGNDGFQMCPAEEHLDLLLDDDGVEHNMVGDPEVDRQVDAYAKSWMLPNALKVPGVMHIATNCETDLLSHLVYYNEYVAYLTEVVKFFIHLERTTDFVTTCLWDEKNPDHVAIKAMLENRRTNPIKTIPHLKRWKTVSASSNTSGGD